VTTVIENEMPSPDREKFCGDRDMHPIIRKSRELLEGRAEQEAQHVEWAKGEHKEWQTPDAKADAAKSAVKHRDVDRDGLVYRRNDDARVQSEQTQPVSAGWQMSPELQQEWTDWVNNLIAQQIEDYHQQVADEFDLVTKSLRDEITALRAELRLEIRGASNKLIIYDGTDARMRKELADTPEKVFDWDQMRKRV
jgi:hypothetical protein